MRSRMAKRSIDLFLDEVEPDTIFSPADILRDVHESAGAVRARLRQLEAQGRIKELFTDLYYRVQVHPELGELIPDPDKIAHSIAQHQGNTIMPSGALAANRLGLTTQVPAHVQYLTDGAPYDIKLGPFVIEMRHASDAQREYIGTPAGMVIEALTTMGERHVTESVFEEVTRRLSDTDRQQLAGAERNAPEWLRHFIQRLAKT